MFLEVEQKFPVADLAPIRAQLAALGATPRLPQEQRDTYYAHPVRDFRRTDEALRLRKSGYTNKITYKGPKLDSETKTRREIEVEFDSNAESYGQLAELLQALDFARVATVRKEREPWQLTWQGHEVEVALDTVADVGTFVELEIGTDETGQEGAKLAVASLAARLGLSANERRSYLELLLNGRHKC
ncbi:MAG: class IV adenylate cyclase [Pirellulaceae bacterium]|nr:class IV adenylate cyclase [Pirellulaceae bacterium]